MKFSTKEPKLSQLKADLLGIGFTRKGLVSPLGKEIDRRLHGTLTRLIKNEELKGQVGETRVVASLGRIPISNILLIGLEDSDSKSKPVETGRSQESLRKSAALFIKVSNKCRAKSVAIEDFSDTFKSLDVTERAHAIAEGAIMANYRFTRYKKSTNNQTVRNVILITRQGRSASKGLQKGVVYGEATNLARDLINTPAIDMTPRAMAAEARKIGRLPRLRVNVLNKSQIEKLGMGCYLAVAMGSVEPPYFIHLHYKPSGRPKKKIALIGKGVNFDSGGLSLKPPPSMETMKDDMSGSASMVAVMKALAQLKPNVEVHGFAAMTENMPSGTAIRPGDIVRSMNGKTVEILNTDAEGRLTLADALTYAQRYKPDCVIDFATLTGACIVALGERCSAIMGNNQKLVDQLISSGKRAGEKIWQLPLVEEYRDDLKSPAADIKNVGGRWGGTITAGLFLQEFVDPKMPWAHLDIAGPSWTDKELDYCPRGGTGHLVRTLLDYIENSF